MSEILEVKERKGVRFENKEFVVPFSKREVKIRLFVPFLATIRVGWNARNTNGYLESYVVLPTSVTADKTEVVVSTPDDDYGPVFLTSKQRIQIVVGEEGENVLIEVRADDREIYGL